MFRPPPFRSPVLVLPLIAATLAGFGVGLPALRSPRTTDAVALPHTFVAGDTARASEVNANFTALAAAISAIAQPTNTIVVAPAGAAFDSVADALNSITTASVSNPFTVLVAPGVYAEVELCRVPPFVQLQGSGVASTFITSARSSASKSATSATIQLDELSGLADVTVENSGTADTFALALFGESLSNDTRVDRCNILANGAGGAEHFAAYFIDSDLTLSNSILRASGATSANIAYGADDLAGPFSQPRIVSCVLEAKVVGTGIAMSIDRTSAQVESSTLEGWSRGLASSTNGVSFLRDCVVRTLGTPAFEQTGSAAILSATTHFIASNPIGNAGSFKYVHCFNGNYTPVVDGFGSSVQ